MSPLLRFAIAAVLLVALVGGGTVGYRMIEGWTLLDSLYMTLIALGNNEQLEKLLDFVKG